MKCPCCGAETPDVKVLPKLWDYKAFSEWVKSDITYSDYKKYDLENYFMQVLLKFNALTTWKLIFDKIKFFILQDINSNGKFPVKMAAVVKQDIQAVAFDLIRIIKDEIKSENLPDEIEAVAFVKRIYPDMPEWKHPSFELYVERALKHYKLVD